MRSNRDPVAKARAACRRSYDRLKAGGGLDALTADRIYADTLARQDGKRAGVQAEMFERTRMLLDLLHDRASWPR